MKEKEKVKRESERERESEKIDKETRDAEEVARFGFICISVIA